MKHDKKSKAAKAADVTVSAAGGVFGAIMKGILTVLLVFLTTGLLFACIFAFYVKTCLVDEMQISLSDFSLSLSSKILYQDADDQWQELCTIAGGPNRVWVDYDDIPLDMQHAAVAIEDKRFYTHKGVDWYRTVYAFVNMFLGMKSDFGGSTITQQLIKNLLQKNEDITVQRKLLEIFQALELEKKYDKQEIMKWYLNAIYFGENCWGVCTAAQTYFNKTLDQLSLAECASIVAITNNPSKYDPFVSVANNKERQELILRAMYEQEYISYDDYIAAKEEPLVFVRSENEAYEMDVYSYYEETVISDVLQDLMERKGINLATAKTLLYSGGYRIYSCYDPRIQASVDAVYTDLAALPQSYRSTAQQLQSAIVIMDPYTGKIVALSGGVGEKAENLILNRIDSQRPAGSSIKPLASYGPALEYGYITQNTLVDDSPDIQLSGTWWYPRNSGGGNQGIITIRKALVGSVNTVAAQIVDKLGLSTSFDYLTKKLGFTTLVEDDRSYAPLSLGQFTNGVTVREMTQAYCSFVNYGIFTQSRTYEKVTEADGKTLVMDNPAQTHVAWSENTAANILNMLQGAVSGGTGGEAYLSFMPVAGKTGTTSDNWDRWFMGMTPYYVAGVWTGYDTPSPMYYYGNPAAQIWKKVMSSALEGMEYRAFPWPDVGGDTQLFGDLTDKLAEQEEEKRQEEGGSPSPNTSASPSPSVSPSHSPTPSATIAPIESDALQDLINAFLGSPTPTVPVG